MPKTSPPATASAATSYWPYWPNAISCRDGSPRISPAEPDIANGRLYFSMIWHSYKALDHLRDPRCAIHSLILNRSGEGGEFKLYGRTPAIADLEERAIYCRAIFARFGRQPEEPLLPVRHRHS